MGVPSPDTWMSAQQKQWTKDLGLGGPATDLGLIDPVGAVPMGKDPGASPMLPDKLDEMLRKGLGRKRTGRGIGSTFLTGADGAPTSSLTLAQKALYRGL